MSLSDPVDIYCERLGPHYWAEPLNAISNAAFVMAALWAVWTMLQFHRQEGQKPRKLDVALVILAAMIGVGSYLFHTHANRWSEWADTIPIWSFVGLYLYASIAGRPSASVRLRAITGALCTLAVIYVLFSMATGEAADSNAVDPLNGSGQYAPALIALLIVTVLSFWRKSPVAVWFGAATVTFFLSLSFRTFDMQACDHWHHGTHFMWHILNGLMIGFLLQARLRTRFT